MQEVSGSIPLGSPTPDLVFRCSLILGGPAPPRAERLQLLGVRPDVTMLLIGGSTALMQPEPEALSEQAIAMIGRGRAWHDRGDHDLAIAEYTDVIALHPDHCLAYFLRGAVWADKQEHDRVIADCTKAISLE